MVMVRVYPPFSGDLKVKDYCLDISGSRQIQDLPALAKDTGHEIFESISRSLKCHRTTDIFEHVLILRNDEVVKTSDYVKNGDVIKIVSLLQGG